MEQSKPAKNTYRIGAIFPTNDGQTVKIIEEAPRSPSGGRRFLVEFQDEHKYRKTFAQATIHQGRMKNPYLPTVAGVGYLGVGKYSSSKNHKDTRAYDAWSNMLNRCYNKDNRDYEAYKDITVCDEWKCFQNYAEWFELNSIKGWEPDKDILDPFALEYSPETVMFIPPEYNKKFSRKKMKPNGLLQGVTEATQGFCKVKLDLFENQKSHLKACDKDSANYMASSIRILDLIETFSSDPHIHPEGLAMIIRRLMEQYVILKLTKAKPNLPDTI